MHFSHGNVAFRKMTPDNLTDEELTKAGLVDTDRARRILVSLAGQGVTDDIVEQLRPRLLAALANSPDPDRSLLSFARWTDAVTSRYTHFQEILRHPVALEIFLNVCGTSQFFSDILIRNPEYLEILANPGVRGGAPRSAGRLYRDLSSFVDCIARPEIKLEAMRRFRQREVLRIGVRDILGLADMPTTAREFSSLADACIHKSYEVALAQISATSSVTVPAFAVIGMGKLGGRELNYSSDVDLMFVCGDEAEGPAMEAVHKLAELTVNGLSREMQNGHAFRVDMRLRPEGRFGALVRTFSSYAAYYESWAEPWELQALIKARPVAGDPALGRQFMELIRPYVYRRSLPKAIVDEVRKNKERIEQRAEMNGESRTNVKTGIGGIRDIEFLVQLHQLELGGANPLLRTPSTLEALGRLAHSRVIDTAVARELAEDYCWLRTVEHRLQILYDRQTQLLPAQPTERHLLARRLGYANEAEFDADYTKRTTRVRTHFDALFRSEHAAAAHGIDDPIHTYLLNVEEPGAHAAIVEYVERLGFAEPDEAYRIIRDTVVGTTYGRMAPEARDLMVGLAAPMLQTCARTSDPDSALRGIESLAQAVPNRAHLYRSFQDSPELLSRICSLAAGAPPLVQSLARHLEWLDLLVSEEIIDSSVKPADACREEIAERTCHLDGDAFWDGLATYIQRERLRIGARDLWNEIDAAKVGRELSALADAVIGTLVERARSVASRSVPGSAAQRALSSVAVIGLGKLGGCETGYGSDWDILVVYADDTQRSAAPEGTDSFRAVNALTEWVLAAGPLLRVRGAAVEIDARLRPEGRFGALARTVRDYQEYYTRSAETWERQSLLKARAVAGDPATARVFLRMLHGYLYAAPLTADETEAIRHMKRRIETERLKVDERHTDIKLGFGGLADIEFTAQLLQLRHGATEPSVRCTGTVDALHALASIHAIPGPHAARLADTYDIWTTLRHRLSLMGAPEPDILPSDVRRLRSLALGIGEADGPGIRAEAVMRERFEERMADTRTVVERLFYRDPAPTRRHTGGEPR